MIGLAIVVSVAGGSVSAAVLAMIASTHGRRPLAWAALAFLACGGTCAAMFLLAGSLSAISDAAVVTVGYLAPVTVLLAAIGVGFAASRPFPGSLVTGVRVGADICMGPEVAGRAADGPYRSPNLPFERAVLVLTQVNLGLEIGDRSPELVAYRSLVAVESHEECVVLRWTAAGGGLTGAVVRLRGRAAATKLARRIERLRPRA